MALDGFFIHHLANELNTELKNVRIKKIRQPYKDVFTFEFFRKGSFYLRFNLNPNFPHVRITAEDLPFDEKSNLLNALRKHIEDALLLSVEQHLQDRVLIFSFQKFDQIFGYTNYKVIFEAMGRTTNLILLKDNIILDAHYKQFSSDKRSVLINQPFEFFTIDKKEIDKDSLDLLKTCDSPKEIMDTFMGISLHTATFIYQNKALNPYSILKNPTLYQSSKKLFSPVDINLDYPKIHFETLSQLLSQIDQKESPKDTQLKGVLAKEIKRLEAKSLHLNADLEMNLNYDKYKEMADAIYMSGLDLNEKLSALNDLKLDSQKTLNDNAQGFYKLYHKAKKAIRPIENQIELNNNLLKYYKGLLDVLVYAQNDDIKDLKDELSETGLIKQVVNKQKNKKPVKPKILSYTFDDFQVFIGKSSLQNEYLTHELGQKDDYWFHVKQGSGSHVILRGAFHEKSLRTAAMLAAYYSPMRNSSSVPVDYTRLRNIKKIKGLPGYNVSYKDQKTIYIDIDLNLLELPY